MRADNEKQRKTTPRPYGHPERRLPPNGLHIPGIDSSCFRPETKQGKAETYRVDWLSPHSSIQGERSRRGRRKTSCSSPFHLEMNFRVSLHACLPKELAFYTSNLQTSSHAAVENFRALAKLRCVPNRNRFGSTTALYAYTYSYTSFHSHTHSFGIRTHLHTGARASVTHTRAHTLDPMLLS